MLYFLLLFFFLTPFQETDNRSIYREKTLALIDRYLPDYKDVMSDHLYYPEDGVKYVGNKKVPNPTPTDENLILDDIGTIVHESVHGYNSRTRVFVEPGEEYAIPDIEVMRSRKMVSYLRKICPIDSLFRFDTYLGVEAMVQTSNMYGIVGLLDEYSAYYHGTNASYQFWKNGQGVLSEDQLKNLKNDALASYFAFYEFETFIGGYLSYTREHEPEIYKATKECAELISAYSELHKKYQELCEEIQSEFKDDSILKYYERSYTKPAQRTLKNFETELAAFRVE